MHRKLSLGLAVLALAFTLTGCASAWPTQPVPGFNYSDVKAPLDSTANGTYSKVGTAQLTSILGWITTGDASINTAAKNAGITKIHHVDFHSKSVLGVYAEFTTYVYGD